MASPSVKFQSDTTDAAMPTNSKARRQLRDGKGGLIHGGFVAVDHELKEGVEAPKQGDPEAARKRAERAALRAAQRYKDTIHDEAATKLKKMSVQEAIDYIKDRPDAEKSVYVAAETKGQGRKTIINAFKAYL